MACAEVCRVPEHDATRASSSIKRGQVMPNPVLPFHHDLFDPALISRSSAIVDCKAASTEATGSIPTAILWALGAVQKAMVGMTAEPVIVISVIAIVSLAGFLLRRWFIEPAEKLGRRSISRKGQSIAAAGMVEFDAQERVLAREMAAILVLVQGQLSANRGYARSLLDTKVSLVQATEPEQVRQIVQLLVSENERMVQETGVLENGLEKSRRQIEQLRSSLAAAEEMGSRDALTALSNRRQFDKVLAVEIARAQAEQLALCLVMGDIDHFKQINDKYGHVAGDKVLQNLAQLLTSNVKGRDTVARYGGEEFAIILPQTTVGDAYQLTEQIRSRLEASNWQAGKGDRPLGRITASFGIAQLDDGDDPMSLIQRADARLYDSKRLGRNRITLDASATKRSSDQKVPVSLVQA